MAQFSLSPSIEVREWDITQSVPSVSTSIGAFAGAFNWGPVEKIITLADESDLKKRFGVPLDSNRIDWYCARNFLAYSSHLKCVRVVDTTRATNATGLASMYDGQEYTEKGILVKNAEHFEDLKDSPTLQRAKVVARYPGALGNSLCLSICDGDTEGSAAFKKWRYKDSFNSQSVETTYMPSKKIGTAYKWKQNTDGEFPVTLTYSTDSTGQVVGILKVDFPTIADGETNVTERKRRHLRAFRNAAKNIKSNADVVFEGQSIGRVDRIVETIKDGTIADGANIYLQTSDYPKLDNDVTINAQLNVENGVSLLLKIDQSLENVLTNVSQIQLTDGDSNGVTVNVSGFEKINAVEGGYQYRLNITDEITLQDIPAIDDEVDPNALESFYTATINGVELRILKVAYDQENPNVTYLWTKEEDVARYEDATDDSVKLWSTETINRYINATEEQNEKLWTKEEDVARYEDATDDSVKLWSTEEVNRYVMLPEADWDVTNKIWVESTVSKYIESQVTKWEQVLRYQQTGTTYTDLLDPTATVDPDTVDLQEQIWHNLETDTYQATEPTDTTEKTTKWTNRIDGSEFYSYNMDEDEKSVTISMWTNQLTDDAVYVEPQNVNAIIPQYKDLTDDEVYNCSDDSGDLPSDKADVKTTKYTNNQTETSVYADTAPSDYDVDAALPQYKDLTNDEVSIGDVPQGTTTKWTNNLTEDVVYADDAPADYSEDALLPYYKDITTDEVAKGEVPEGTTTAWTNNLTDEVTYSDDAPADYDAETPLPQYKDLVTDEVAKGEVPEGTTTKWTNNSTNVVTYSDTEPEGYDADANTTLYPVTGYDYVTLTSEAFASSKALSQSNAAKDLVFYSSSILGTLSANGYITDITDTSQLKVNMVLFGDDLTDNGPTIFKIKNIINSTTVQVFTEDYDADEYTSPMAFLTSGATQKDAYVDSDDLETAIFGTPVIQTEYAKTKDDGSFDEWSPDFTIPQNPDSLKITFQINGDADAILLKVNTDYTTRAVEGSETGARQIIWKEEFYNNTLQANPNGIVTVEYTYGTIGKRVYITGFWNNNGKVIRKIPNAPVTSVMGERRNVEQDLVHVVVVDKDGSFTGTKDTVLEKFENLSKAKDGTSTDGIANYYIDYINKNSAYVYVTSDLTTGYSTDAEAEDRYYDPELDGSNETVVDGMSYTIMKNQGEKWGSSYEEVFGGKFDTLNVPLYFDLAYGEDDHTYIGTDEKINGYRLFQDQETCDVSLIITGNPGADETFVEWVSDNISSTRRDCITFISPPLDTVLRKEDAVEKMITFRNNLNNSTYAVMDTGWKYQYDSYNDVYFWCPLNPDMAGLCANVDEVRAPWYSPAGYNRGYIKDCVKLAYNPSRKAERDDLYQMGINPVITQLGSGTLLLGDRTMTTDTTAFREIGIRRLFILVEKAIAQYAKTILFEFNDVVTRSRFINTVTPYLRDIQGRRGITDFYVRADETVNTPEVIDSQGFVGDILIKPQHSINFIRLNFAAIKTGATFEEVELF